jgi:exonuclease III
MVNPYYEINNIDCYNPMEDLSNGSTSGHINISSNHTSYTSDGTLKLFHQNIRGLKHKTDELRNALGPNPPHALCLTEHHMSSLDVDFVTIDQYNLGAVYCRNTFSKGGVCIYVHNSLNYSNINLDSFSIDQIIEICAVKIQSAQRNICVIAIYRAPTGNFVQFLSVLDRILSSIYYPGLEIVICGDINVNYLNVSSRKKQLNTLLLTYNLSSIVNFPTRSQNNSVSLIDNIFIDNSHSGKYRVYPMRNGLSDHDAQLLIFSNIYMQVSKFIISTRRMFSDQSLANFKWQLSFETWEDVFNGNDVDTIFNCFLNTYLRIFNTCFPLKKIITPKFKTNNWITPGIRNSCRHKRELYLLLRNKNDTKSKSYYKLYCRILSRVINAAKRMHYDGLIANSNNKMKATWNIVKSVTNGNSGSNIIQSLLINGNTFDNKQVIADSFQNYFLSITDKIVSTYKNDDNREKNCIDYLYRAFKSPYPGILFDRTTTKEIQNIIKSLKSKNSYGYDGISVKILKMSSLCIAAPLNYICNRSILSGLFPTRLKYSVIKPLFKKGDKKDIKNYRPISLLTSFSKIFEKVIYIRLNNHVINNNIFSVDQYGFRSNSSTEKASFKLINDILQALNNKSYVGGIFCDLEKAFDCVNHDLLMKKLKFYGITDNAYALIKSYLNDRYHRVCIDGDKSCSHIFSEWGKIKHGVPQGSILGPILFLFYINDLPDAINYNSLPVLFADDTSLIVSNPDLTIFKNDLIQVFKQLHRWFNANLLSLNYNKTQFVQFCTTNSSITQIEISHNNKCIVNSSNTRFLGIILDEGMSWKDHTDGLKVKLSKACYAIRFLRPLVSHESLRTIYFSYFHAVMTYGIIFWGNSSHSDSIFKLQKRVIRIITYSRNKDSCRDLFKELNILPFYSQYLFSLLNFVIDNKSWFRTNMELYDINTRNKYNLHITQPRLSSYKNGAYYMGIKAFNQLPCYIKELSDDRIRFKNILKNYLLSKSFYSLKEFFFNEKF